MSLRTNLLMFALSLATLAVAGDSAQAQGNGKSKEYSVTGDRALDVTREVLVKQGFEVIRVEDKGDYRIIHYRRGNMGKGKGKGPPATMIIRKVRNRIVFENAPSGILVDIDVRLKIG